MYKDIAVVILNYIQYVNIVPGINKLIEKGYNVDIYCPFIKTNDGFDIMYNDNIRNLKEKGYNVYTKVSKKKYKILLEPYPYMNIESKYKIRYRYSNISAKPNIVYKPENYLRYDGILCSGQYDSNYLNVLTQTYITGNMKFINFKRKKKEKSKTVLVYLPTYGDESSIDMLKDYFKNLKKYYYIITKIHHGTTFLNSEKDRIKYLKMYSDEFYDCNKDVDELLSIADVVLTDNSGSIFEALYTYVPVAVFCDDINKNKLMNFDTTQYVLFKEGILPYTNRISKLKETISKAMSKDVSDKQKKWSNNNLYHPVDQTIDFVNTIEKFMNDDVNERYLQMHEILREKYIYNLNETKRIPLLNDTIDKLNLELNSVREDNRCIMEKNIYLNDENLTLKKELKKYQDGKLYKLSQKIYKIKGELIWRKK